LFKISVYTQSNVIHKYITLKIAQQNVFFLKYREYLFSETQKSADIHTNCTNFNQTLFVNK